MISDNHKFNGLGFGVLFCKAILALCLSFPNLTWSSSERYRFNWVDYSSQGEAEAAMRAAYPLWASDLHLCKINTSATQTALIYCTTPQPATPWLEDYHVQYVTPPACATDPHLGDYCPDESVVVADAVAQAVTSPSVCLDSHEVIGQHEEDPPLSWVRNSYVDEGFTTYYLSASHSDPWLPQRRQLVIRTRSCADPDGPISTSVRRLIKRSHHHCPAGYLATAGNPTQATWPLACLGGSATLTKASAENITSCPQSGRPCAPATGEKLLHEPDFTWSGQTFVRHYASGHETPAGAGLPGPWSHSFAERLQLPAPNASSSTPVGWRTARNDREDFVQLQTTGVYRSVTRSGRVLHREPDGTWWLGFPDGRVRHFDAQGRLVYRGDVEAPAQGLHFQYEAERLVRVEDGRGRYLELIETDGRLSTIQDAAGQPLVHYDYDAAGRLVAAHYPDATHRAYHYAEPAHLCVGGEGSCEVAHFQDHLTGLTDENGQRRLEVWYDRSGKVVRSTHAEGAGDTHLAYLSATDTEMTEPGRGRSRYRFTRDAYREPVSRQLYEDGVWVGTETWAKFSDGSERHTDRNGVATRTFYDAQGLMIRRTEAERQGSNSNLPERRTTHWTWTVGRIPRPAQRRVEDAAGTVIAQQDSAYNARGQRIQLTVTDPVTQASRTTRWTYCEAADLEAPLEACPLLGAVKTVEAPGGGLTRVQYRTDDAGDGTYRRGDVWRIINPMGHALEILAYDPAGRILSARDPNGGITDWGYHPRGWLTSITVRGATPAQDAVTRLDYRPTGEVARITGPDGVVLQYEYDRANRLIALEDGAGNRMAYGLDAAGNRIEEGVWDALGALRQQRTRVFNPLGQLRQDTDAYGHTTERAYDANGNPTHHTDALGTLTHTVYDALNRPRQRVQDLGGLGATTQWVHDALDRVVEVIDPRGLVTQYRYNGLGDLEQHTSPDTGMRTFEQDAAGRIARIQDARGIETHYTHDALGRLTTLDPGATGATTVTFTHDTVPQACPPEAVGVGHLGRMEDASGQTEYCHDRRGNRVGKVQTVGDRTLAVAYGYTRANRLAWVRYPDGLQVDYDRDALGRVSALRVTLPGQAPQTLLSGVHHHPFGPVAQLHYGDGTEQARPRDLAGRPVAVAAGTGLSLGYAYDGAGRLTTLRAPAAGAPVRTYAYDALDRLTQSTDPVTLEAQAYGYDAIGNRVSHTRAGVTELYTYAAAQHWLTGVGPTARSYDAAGHTTAIGTRTLHHDARGRLHQVDQNGIPQVRYGYNGVGEQVWRESLVGTPERTDFLYDTAGRLLGQYAATGQPRQQYLWLEDLPVGVVMEGRIYPVQADHLGTPRAVVDPDRGVVVWAWPLPGEGFGAEAPDEDPDGDGVGFRYDLRFPGQRYDGLTGLHYNYFRDYDPETGRYIQSDPIGLAGGLNTYLYANANPLRFIDPLGLRGGCPANMRPGPGNTCVFDPGNNYRKECANGQCGANFPETVNVNPKCLTKCMLLLGALGEIQNRVGVEALRDLGSAPISAIRRGSKVLLNIVTNQAVKTIALPAGLAATFLDCIEECKDDNCEVKQ